MTYSVFGGTLNLTQVTQPVSNADTTTKTLRSSMSLENLWKSKPISWQLTLIILFWERYTGVLIVIEFIFHCGWTA